MYFKLQPQTNKKINFKHRTVLLNIRNTLFKKLLPRDTFRFKQMTFNTKSSTYWILH